MQGIKKTENPKRATEFCDSRRNARRQNLSTQHFKEHVIPLHFTKRDNPGVPDEISYTGHQ